MTQREPTQPGRALATAGQALLQAPQWVVFARVSVSQPLVTFESQSPKPVEQVVIVHIPLVHAPMALGGLHTTPQPPQ